MASIVITIETDGAAFHKYPGRSDSVLNRVCCGGEVARILREIATEAECGGVEAARPPCDHDGIPIGTLKVIG